MSSRCFVAVSPTLNQYGEVSVRFLSFLVMLHMFFFQVMVLFPVQEERPSCHVEEMQGVKSLVRGMLNDQKTFTLKEAD